MPMPTPVITRRPRTALSLSRLALIFAAGCALTTAAASAQVAIDLRFQPHVISFSPLDPPVYVLFSFLTATGFSDETNPANRVRIVSGDGSFTAEVTPGTFSSGSSSIGLQSVGELEALILNTGVWNMEVYDGNDATTMNYSFTVSTQNLQDDFLRPISVDAVPDVTIDPSPSFNFSIPPSFNPAAEYSSSFAAIFANINGSNSVFSPSLSINDTSWAPDGPLNNDIYLFYLRFDQPDCPSTLVEATYPEPIDGFPLSSFSQSVSATSESQVARLRVGEVGNYSVQLIVDPAVLNFSPFDPAQYILGVLPSATGFVDESNLNNYVRFESIPFNFSGDLYPARGTGSGTTGSTTHPSTQGLIQVINGSTQWQLSLTDGTTGSTSVFNVNLNCLGFDDSFLSPTILDVAPGDIISATPTFNFSRAPASVFDAAYTSAFAFLVGTQPGNSYSSPAITPLDFSWTPDGPIAPDTYTVIVGAQNSKPTESYFQIGQPTFASGASASATFSAFTTTFSTTGQSGDLVSQTYCPADFNQDGGIDGADVEAFFDQWSIADPTADVDQSGGIDGADVEYYFVIWQNAGC